MRLLTLFLAWGAIACASETEIVRRLQEWPQDFNAKNVEKVCGLFAPDLIASYPGTEDRDYTQMCDQLTKILNSKDKTYRYKAPEIEQIIMSQDIAIVRLIWTLEVTKGTSTETVKEKGLDVFRQQKDGSWKIAISYAYSL